MADEIVHLRIPDHIYKRLQKVAKEQARPLSNLLRYIILKYAEGTK